jgi:hypothetical protein
VCSLSAAALKLPSLATQRNVSTKRKFIPKYPQDLSLCSDLNGFFISDSSHRYYSVLLPAACSGPLEQRYDGVFHQSLIDRKFRNVVSSCSSLGVPRGTYSDEHPSQPKRQIKPMAEGHRRKCVRITLIARCYEETHIPVIALRRTSKMVIEQMN